MATKRVLVNLDAMITRADFAVADGDAPLVDNVNTISLRDFQEGGMMGPSLRKPDFQRETNHWSPEQVVSLLECFVNGDLIPSIILWQSSTFVFVIDGGHRLSVLKAWVTDDYGDGPVSQSYFGYSVSDSQKAIAKRTRELVARRVGSFQHIVARLQDPNLDPAERRRVSLAASRALQIQWVKGDASKAESSFFKINMQGTPLDKIEEMLLKSRRRPIAIAARAVIRSGKGHKYWSEFDPATATQIEEHARSLHSTLFDPELQSPVKTLDLPLGGPKGVRAALQTLIDFILVAAQNQQGEPRALEDEDEDSDGAGTVRVLKKAVALARRLTGNDGGSLGLHPAVYFYGPTGRHSDALFMGTVMLLGRKLAHNDSKFFLKFTEVRQRLEAILTAEKDLIATILQKTSSRKRAAAYADLLDAVIKELASGKAVDDQALVQFARVDGKVFVGSSTIKPREFSDDTKSQAFIRLALESAPKCPICNGYLDAEKSVSYDHVLALRDGGAGGIENIQLTHPYCNQSVKH